MREKIIGVNWWKTVSSNTHLTEGHLGAKCSNYSNLELLRIEEELKIMEEDDTNVFGVDPDDLEDVEELLLNDFDIEDSSSEEDEEGEMEIIME